MIKAICLASIMLSLGMFCIAMSLATRADAMTGHEWYLK